MAWEKRGSGRYYYQKRRRGDRVVSEYIGAGDLAWAVSTLDAAEQEQRRAELARQRQERAAELDIDRQLDRIAGDLRALVAVALLTRGYHSHKGQWRRKREQEQRWSNGDGARQDSG